MLEKNKPIPPDLIPPRPEIYRNFIEQILDQEIIEKIRKKALKAQVDWHYFSPEMKFNLFKSFYEILFSDFFPEPICKTTYNRLDATALFYSSQWSISFTENFLKQNFDLVFKTWIHENYHGFLHFLSLRFNFSAAVEIISTPIHVSSLARQHPIPNTEKIAITLAKRNLIGVLDRLNSQGASSPFGGMKVSINSDYNSLQSRLGTGWDSYYLNVEIPVENLTEITFKIILPNTRFRRSYTTAEKYIEKRMNGIAPSWAKQEDY